VTSEVYLYDAVRTPFGRYGEALAGTRPDDLAAHVVRTIVDRDTLAEVVAADIEPGSFAMMRGGHLDVCVLGAYQVSANGDLANWHTGDQLQDLVDVPLDLS
jgi:acyl CoA:acetate/3-ketoacid CoA transferase beta subunit